MTQDHTLRLLLIAGVVLTFAMRPRPAKLARGAAVGGVGERLFVGACMMWVLTVLADICTAGVATVPMALPLWARWVGFGLAAACVPWSAWTYRTLDKQYSPKLQLLGEHELVMRGPYAWVRHPMYLSFAVTLVGINLMTANLLVWIASALIVCLLPWRMGKEEAMLEQHFGERYRAYRLRTGALVPKLW